MKKRKKIIALVGLLIIGSLAIAGNYSGWFNGSDNDNNQPDAKEEYRRLYERYTRTDSIMNLRGVITLYDGENPTTVKEQSNFEYAKQGKQFYSQLSSLQTFCDGKLVLQLDTVNKIIALSPMNSEDIPADQSQSSLNMFFSDTAAFRFSGGVSGNNQERTLTCRHELIPDIRLFRLIYDPVSYQLRKAEIEWWKNPLITDTTRKDEVWITKISYQNATPAPWKADELMNKIIRVTEKGIEPMTRYKDYTIYDLTSEQ
jgi:hypothetical protein